MVGFCVNGFVGALLKVYLIWLVQHFAAQSYGLALLYCYKHQYIVTGFDKKLLFALLNTAAGVAVVHQLSDPHYAITDILGQRIPEWGNLPDELIPLSMIALETLLAMFVGRLFLRFLKTGQCLPLPASMIIATSITLCASGYELFGVFWMYAPAFFHASQYLVVTMSAHLQKTVEMTSQDKDALMRVKNGIMHSKELVLENSLRYYATALLISVALFIALPSFFHLLGYSYQLAFANVFCVVSLHHFASDAVIWKLRDPRLRTALQLPNHH
jgi:hypothetical protein